MGFHGVDRVGDDLLDRHALVQQGVDERGVGAVLQQAANQVGQQVFVTADRRVGPQGDAVIEVVGGLVERLAHAVEALVLDLDAGVLGHAHHGRQGVGVVGGELGVEVRCRSDQGLGVDQVRQVGGGLGRIDRIVRTAGDLAALDLAVPVGALHEADHQAAAGLFRQRLQAGDHLAAALLIGLDGQAEALPFAQFRLAAQLVEKLQRQGQAVGLFGVDREVDVVAGGDLGQAQGAGI